MVTPVGENYGKAIVSIEIGGNSKSTFETKLTNNTQISYQNNKHKNPNQLIALGRDY